MPNLTAGQSATIDIPAGMPCYVSTTQDAYVDLVAGAPGSGYTSDRLAGSRLAKLYGPWTTPAKVKIRSVLGTTTYGGSYDAEPLEIGTKTASEIVAINAAIAAGAASYPFGSTVINSDTGARWTLSGLGTAAVFAVDGAGNSTPFAPSAPTIGTATAGNATVTLPFSAPANPGASSILDYQAMLVDGTTKSISVSPAVFAAMTNGAAYVGAVRARNTQGYGAWSAQSNSVTPAAATTTLNALASTRLKVPTSIASTFPTLTVSQRSHFVPSVGAASALTFTDQYWALSDTFSITTPTGTPTLPFRKWVEYPAGTFTPVLYTGLPDYQLDTTTRSITSDALAVSIPADAQYWEHTQYTGASTVSLPCIELPATAATLGALDAKYTAASVGAVAHQASGQASTFFFGSTIITATLAGVGAKSVAVLGDSIAWGQGDITSSGAKASSGYLGRSLAAQGVGTLVIGKPGMSASDFVTIINTSTGTLPAMWAALTTKVKTSCTHFINEAGINDLRLARTVAQVVADSQTIYGAFTGPKIGQITYTPCSDSTDAWATTANQTPKTDGNRGQLSALNDTVRAGIVGANFVIEASDVASSARNSGIFKAPPAATTDGVHPNSYMCGYLATNMALALP